MLKHLEGYGFDILAISLDGQPLQRAQFTNTRTDSGQASLLGVTSTPAIYLMDEEGHFSPIGQTVLSFAELKRRILLVALREGWVSQEELNETKPILNPNEQQDLSKDLPKLLLATQENPAKLLGEVAENLGEAVKAIQAQSLDGQSSNPDGFIPPSILLSMVKATDKTRTKGGTAGTVATQNSQEETER